MISLTTRILYSSIVHGFIIIVSGIIAYSNTFHAPFYFDDISNIVDNYALRDLNNFWPPTGLRYFGFLTFALNYYFGELNTFGYHIVNITVHILNAILVYYLVGLTFKTPFFSNQQSAIGNQQSEETNFDSPIHPFSSASGGQAYLPLFIALLFVSHPIQTQAVTYIVQRFTSLATLFYLLALVMYIKFRLTPSLTLPPRGGGRGGGAAAKRYAPSAMLYAVSLISAILAMKTKEITFTLPVVVVLYEFMFFEGNIRKRILYLIPIIFAMLIIPLSIIGIDKPIGDAIGELREVSLETAEIPRWSYLFTQFRVIGTYIRLLFFPVNQNLDYDYPVYHSFSNPGVFLSFLFLLSIFGLGVYLIRSRRSTLYALRLTAFGIFWFFITLSVESSIIPIRDVINEHRLYLPGIGICIAGTTSLFFAADKACKEWLPALKVVKPLLTLIILVLLGATYARNELWKDEVRLWEDVTAKSPKKARGYNGLGLAFENKNQYPRAVEAYNKAIALDINYMSSYTNRGAAYNNMGLYDKAVKDFSIVIRMHPMDPFFINAYFNRGVAYYGLGLYERAVEDNTRVITMALNHADAYNNRGAAYEKMGQINKAIEDYTRVIDIDSGNALAFYNRAMAYMSVSDSKRARADFKKSCELGSADGCNALASAQ